MRGALLFTTKILIVVSAFLVDTSRLEAQKLVGRWEVQYERIQLMVRHGSSGATQAPTQPDRVARMTLRMRGDSVFGEWQPVVTGVRLVK